jgi:hypothetical protein
MGRKALVCALAVAMVLVGLSTMVLAAQNVANVSQKGSLLIFPKIDTSFISRVEGTSYFHDTIVVIGNDNTKDVWLKCYWVNREQEIEDFMFHLTPNQPIWFRASDGLGTGLYDSSIAPITVPPFFYGDNETGELKCWAVDAGDLSQVVFNHLYGSAVIFDPVNHAALQYNAWSFFARAAGDPGKLVLDGNKYYDACPKYLVFNFFSKGSRVIFPATGDNATFINTELTLVPCNQDLRQDRFPTCTKAKFDIWNENETKYTGAYQCLKCWFEGYLADIGKTKGGFGGIKFTYPNLHTTAGRCRVQGVASSVCWDVFTRTGDDGKPVDRCWTDPADTNYHGQIATPLLGLITTELTFSGDATVAITGTTPNTAGAWGPPLDPAQFPVPQIQWDHDSPPPEAPIR